MAPARKKNAINVSGTVNLENNSENTFDDHNATWFRNRVSDAEYISEITSSFLGMTIPLSDLDYMCVNGEGQHPKRCTNY